MNRFNEDVFIKARRLVSFTLLKIHRNYFTRFLSHRPVLPVSEQRAGGKDEKQTKESTRKKENEERKQLVGRKDIKKKTWWKERNKKSRELKGRKKENNCLDPARTFLSYCGGIFGVVVLSIFTPDSISWPMREISPLIFPGTSLHSCFLLNASGPFAEKQIHIMMLPPPCFRLGLAGLAGLAGLGITHTTLLSPNTQSWIITRGFTFGFVWLCLCSFFCSSVFLHSVTPETVIEMKWNVEGQTVIVQVMRGIPRGRDLWAGISG